LPQTPLGELTALPRTPNCIKGVLLLSGVGGKGREGKGREREEEGRVAPQLGSLDPPVLK